MDKKTKMPTVADTHNKNNMGNDGKSITNINDIFNIALKNCKNDRNIFSNEISSLTEIYSKTYTEEEIIKQNKKLLEQNKKLLEQIAKLYKPKKKFKAFNFKNDYAAIFSDELQNQIIKNHKSEGYKEESKTIKSKKKNTNVGILELEQKTKETDKSHILENYKNISFSREEIQYYLALINVYLQKVDKKHYGIPCEITTNDYHSNVLNKKNRLRKDDLIKYENIFSKMRSKAIIYNPENATIYPFKKKEFKKIRINSNLINVDIVSYNDYEEQKIRITPSALTMLELTTIKQISNFLPIEIITLDFKKNDNMLFFALHTTRMHKSNETYKETAINKRGFKYQKTLYNKTFKWESSIKKFLISSLPNGIELIERHNKAGRQKKQFYERNILNPLKEICIIYAKHGYIHKEYKIPEHKKDIFEDEECKVKLIFHYDNGIIIEAKEKFKKK